jgi:hypothetical protein
MSAVKDAIEAVRAALLLDAEVKRLAEAVRNREHELRDHDRRLVRIETTVGIGGQRKLPQ